MMKRLAALCALLAIALVSVADETPASVAGPDPERAERPGVENLHSVPLRAELLALLSPALREPAAQYVQLSEYFQRGWIGRGPELIRENIRTASTAGTRGRAGIRYSQRLISGRDRKSVV